MSENNLKYDLLIIGGGPGGYVAAIRASQLDDVVDMFKRNTQRSTRKQKDLL